ncbi:carbon-nitrogen hydrolase family protein [Streptomyces sp. NPDC004609]|uniref:carbon-nitrogen hydrolase family protein n=1 Tax=Streptomyces sp. NPDC004609 TaxID=3364704 RepID=UPI00369B52C4
MRIAAAQFTPVPGDVEANAGVMRDLIGTAAGRGARLTVFPELGLTGYALGLIARDPSVVVSEDDPRLGPVREACRETGTAAVVNGAVRTGGGRPAITSLVIGPGGDLLTRYDKRYPHGPEVDLFTAGTRDGRFTLDGVRFALAVCYDNRVPAVAERARADGCAVYAASSALESGNDSFDAVYPVRARDNGLYVVLANATGVNDVGDCRGNSAVWGPDGSVLATAGQESPGLAVAELMLRPDPPPPRTAPARRPRRAEQVSPPR